jgi:iron complex outermembrane recepter protein
MRKTRIKPIALLIPLMLGGYATFGTSAAIAQQGQSPPAADKKEGADKLVVTGSRIAKIDLDSNSPILTITAAELAAFQDVTLESFLNSLPQVNPASTLTSNNPGNGGQASIDLRGLGPNRNLVLIDGRRPQMSAADQTVDLNTIPLSLVEAIEIISGGAGAVYGADAIAGVINIKLKKRFQGLELRAGYTNSQEFNDARERSASMLLGGNFAEGRGNAVVSGEYAEREGMVKAQRPFAAIATATTSFFPEGTYRPTGANLPSQAAVDALYGRAAYGSNAPGSVPNSSVHSFNSDGSLFYPGIFNSRLNVINFRYPVDLNVITNLFPDVYVYNFDAVNLLVLPLERKSLMGKFNFKLDSGVEVFSTLSNTRYNSTTALAPTPVSTITVASASSATSSQGSSALITPGQNVGAQLVVPVTNPFIPADLRTLLASRTGDDARLVGSGATEPFLMRWRTVLAGLRTSEFENDVSQYLAGARGPIGGDNWRWEAYLSEGRTKISQTQSGNIDTNRLLAALAAADGGASLCAGGVNPFGRQPLSAECSAYLSVKGTLTTEFVQKIGQAFVTGTVGELPNGPISTVFGAEFRNFRFELDPGAAAGPISGFNVQNPAAGSNSFRDVFAEASLPVLRDLPFAKSFDVHMAYRTSQSGNNNLLTGEESAKARSNTWALDFSWEPVNTLRLRGSLQQAVRAPNFGELFNGGGAAPQIFDPCSVTSNARTGANAAQLRTLCRDAGLTGGLGAAVDTYVQSPGNQTRIDTSGNTSLKPEKGRTFTLGAVWEPKLAGPLAGLSGSVDFYSIQVKDAIVVADPNEYIADCYNYYGNNPGFDPNYVNCRALFRAGDIIQVINPDTASGEFPGVNGGTIKTSGIDLGLNWNGRVGPGQLATQLNFNYLIQFKLKDNAAFPESDFKGTAAYFPLIGSTFPELRSNWTVKYTLGKFSFDTRMRYIDSMTNRMGKYYPGQSFLTIPRVTYWDIGATWQPDKNKSIRIGVLNAMDKKPPLYEPNIQSGTDPSVYDVVGRRLFVQATMKFN